MSGEDDNPAGDKVIRLKDDVKSEEREVYQASVKERGFKPGDDPA